MQTIKLKDTRPLIDMIHIMEIVNECYMVDLGFPEGVITGINKEDDGGSLWKKKKK